MYVCPSKGEFESNNMAVHSNSESNIKLCSTNLGSFIKCFMIKLFQSFLLKITFLNFIVFIFSPMPGTSMAVPDVPSPSPLAEHDLNGLVILFFCCFFLPSL